MLVEGLQSVLSADPTLVGLLGTPAARGQQSSQKDTTTGIFPMIAMEETVMPYVVYQQVSGKGLADYMAGTEALMTARWRFSCYGTSYKQAKQVAKAVKFALIGLFGPMPGATTKTNIHGVWLMLELDEPEPIPHGTIFGSHLDFQFNYIDLDT